MRTVVDIPEDLWRWAKIHAMDHHTSLTGIVTKALEAYMKVQLGKKSPITSDNPFGWPTKRVTIVRLPNKVQTMRIPVYPQPDPSPKKSAKAKKGGTK
jgi:hypothetical protein